MGREKSYNKSSRENCMKEIEPRISIENCKQNSISIPPLLYCQVKFTWFHTLISITPIIIRSTLKKRDREWLWYCSFQNGSSNFILFLKKPLLTEEEKKKLNCTSFLYIYTPEYNILRKGIWSYHIHTPKLHVWESIINKKKYHRLILGILRNWRSYRCIWI